MKNINFRIFGLFVFIILSWGMAWPVNKIGLAYMTPAWYTAVRLIVGTVTMMALVIAIGKFSLPKRRDFPLIIIIGLLQISVYILLANIGLAYLPAGRSSLLAYTTPLWVMPAATLFFNEEAGILRWAGFFLGIAGLIILLSPWELDWADKNILFGAAMLLLASLCWAVSMICARYMHWSKSPLELIPWQLLTGTVPIVAYAFMQEPLTAIHWNLPLVLSLVYTGILVTGLSYWSGLVVNRELPTIMVSLGFLMVPVVSLIVSSVYMQEAISLPTIAAMILIISGICCVVAKE
ncbi:putative inner membrane transporter yiJE [Aquicella siphonis]|uniref:Putative inner membrane transporter yiJE n=1 Tax=Aquicella siphonis TaxID=254247 RepID=A0A5E4PJM5_9COXI|nr:DMT family transporter [Aquicella siphonis]VVC76551.1 putative inner membrane transporter yiJE [Aquicella siphonis]